MIIEIRTRNARLTRAHASEWQQRVRCAFRRLAHRIERIVLEVAGGPELPARPRHCVLEVRMTDGHVERVETHERRLGPLLRNAIRRAWQAIAWRVPAPRPTPALLPPPARPAAPPSR